MSVVLNPTRTRGPDHSPWLSILLSVIMATVTACGQPLDHTPTPTIDSELFVDVAAEVGLDFVHFNGMSGEFYYPEVFGPGGAFFDYDNDGDLDVYLVQGGMLGAEIGKTFEDAFFDVEPSLPLTDRLYRNDLEIHPDGARSLRFTDVTLASGIVASDYGQGVATGDFDNDGWVDIYVTNIEENQLWRNNGDGTFSDVTSAAGAEDSRFTSVAAFLDIDHDGWLDLYLVNYVDCRLAVHKVCHSPSGQVDYCGPQSYNGQPDRLLRNLGNGTFEDISGPAGILGAAQAGLGVVSADFNNDGWIDIYVANDGMRNNLWINKGDGTFTDTALFAGCAVNLAGQSEASMGVAAEDMDNDGDEDLFMTHLRTETNTFYLNSGDGTFEDATIRTQLASPSRSRTSFGTAILDFDADGWLDIFVASGAVTLIDELVLAGDAFPVHQPNQLFHNLGDGRFRDVSDGSGSVFGLSEVSRGTAMGDIDNDGDADVLVINNSGPVRLLLNDKGQDLDWIGIRARLAGGRDALGARIEVDRPGRPTLMRRVRTDGSYCSANDPRVLFGLGKTTQGITVKVRWPSGIEEEWTDLESGRYLELAEGTGRPKESNR